MTSINRFEKEVTMNWAIHLIYYRWSIFIVAILAIVGCQVGRSEPIISLNPSPVKTANIGLKHDKFPLIPPNPCSPPCWYEIVPGETEFDAALKKVTALSFVTDHWTEDRASDRTTIRWVSEHDDVIIMDGGINLENDQTVSIFVDDPRMLTTVGDIIAQYGSPEAIVAQIYGVEVLNAHVRLYYPERGLGFTAEGILEFNGNICLEAESPIGFYNMTNPGTVDNFIEQVYSMDGQREWVRSRLIPWPGFGCEGFTDH